MSDKPEGRWVDEAYEDYSEDELYEHTPYDPEVVREALYRYGIREYEDLSELARSWLSELADVGLHEPDRQAHFKQADPERPVIDAQEGDLYPVRVGDHRQVFWLKVDGPRTSRGYRNIKVLDKPLRTQMAIVTLLTALEANPTDVEKLREVYSDFDAPLESYVNKVWGAAWWGLAGDEGDKWIENVVRLSPFRFALALLRHYRPDFDDLPPKEQAELLMGAAERVNSFLAASRQLAGFLEYGSPRQDLREAAEDASQDVRAAVLRDVEGSTPLRIAERFGLPITEQQRDKRDHPRVRHMVKRGRRMLENALGADGWRARRDAMKADAERYSKLTTKEMEIQAMVDNGMSVEDARHQVESIQRRSGGSIRRAIFLPGDPD